MRPSHIEKPGNLRPDLRSRFWFVARGDRLCRCEAGFALIETEGRVEQDVSGSYLWGWAF